MASDYQVVACARYESDGSGLEELEKLVKAQIVRGWTPQGGVSVAVVRDVNGDLEYSYYQAMIVL